MILLGKYIYYEDKKIFYKTKLIGHIVFDNYDNILCYYKWSNKDFSKILSFSKRSNMTIANEYCKLIEKIPELIEDKNNEMQ